MQNDNSIDYRGGNVVNALLGCHDLALSCCHEDLFLVSDVSVGKWDLYSFSMLLTIPSSIRTGS